MTLGPLRSPGGTFQMKLILRVKTQSVLLASILNKAGWLQLVSMTWKVSLQVQFPLLLDEWASLEQDHCLCGKKLCSRYFGEEFGRKCIAGYYRIDLKEDLRPSPEMSLPMLFQRVIYPDRRFSRINSSVVLF